MAKSILIVDDTVEYRWMMAVILDRAGYHCNEVISGEEALNALQSGYRPDLIVTDLHMGQGLSGVELLPLLRAIPALREIPILLASSDPYTNRIAREAGFTASLDKSRLSGDLVSSVGALLATTVHRSASPACP